MAFNFRILMNFNRRTIIIIAIILTAVLLWLGVFLIYTSFLGKKTPITPSPTLTPIPKISPFPTFKSKPTITLMPSGKVTLSPTKPAGSEKITVSGVEMNDFTKFGQVTDKQGDVLIARHENYQISYLKPFNQFVITVLSQPFDETSRKAEGDFLTLLAIKKDDACRLNAVITTVSSVDPEKAGKNYNLSWCVD